MKEKIEVGCGEGRIKRWGKRRDGKKKKNCRGGGIGGKKAYKKEE